MYLDGSIADVEVLGHRLRVFDRGRGDGLPLLIIPGHTSRIDGFVDLLAHLAPARRVVVADFPGCGESERPDRSYALRFYEDMAVGLLDALGLEQAIPVGGSLGGNLVLRLGHRFPKRFPTLVLWSPGSAWKARPRLSAFLRRFVADGPGGRPMFWPTVWVQSRFWYDKAWPGRQDALNETFAYYRRIMGPGFLRMYWGIAADQVGFSLFDIASEIEQPTLFMWGTNDNGAGMGAGVRQIRRLLPNVTAVDFEGARHSLEAEVPAALASAINTYLEGSA